MFMKELEKYYNFDHKIDLLADIIVEAVTTDVFDFSEEEPVFSHIKNPRRHYDECEIYSYRFMDQFKDLDVDDYFFMVLTDNYGSPKRWTVAVPKKWLYIDVLDLSKKEYTDFWNKIHEQTSKEFHETRFLVLKDNDDYDFNRRFTCKCYK